MIQLHIWIELGWWWCFKGRPFGCFSSRRRLRRERKIGRKSRQRFWKVNSSTWLLNVLLKNEISFDIYVYYGLISARFCPLHDQWKNSFAYGSFWESIYDYRYPHTLETHKLRKCRQAIRALAVHRFHTMDHGVVCLYVMNFPSSSSSDAGSVTVILRRAEGALVRGERGMGIVTLLTQVNPSIVGKLRKRQSIRATRRKRLASVLLMMRWEVIQKWIWTTTRGSIADLAHILLTTAEMVERMRVRNVESRETFAKKKGFRVQRSNLRLLLYCTLCYLLVTGSGKTLPVIQLHVNLPVSRLITKSIKVVIQMVWTMSMTRSNNVLFVTRTSNLHFRKIFSNNSILSSQ